MMEKESLGSVDDYNKSLNQLANEIHNATGKYIGRGYINFASVVGILEAEKHHLIGYLEKINNPLPMQKLKNPPSYVG